MPKINEELNEENPLARSQPTIEALTPTPNNKMPAAPFHLSDKLPPRIGGGRQSVKVPT